MAIELDNIASGNSGLKINANFQEIERYVNEELLNRSGLSQGEANQMEVNLDMNGFQILNVALDPNNPASLVNKGYVDTQDDAIKVLIQALRQESESADNALRVQLLAEIANRQADIAAIQAQLIGEVPLEGSAFSPISWHEPSVGASIVIPDGKNAWSFGPTMKIESGVSVTVPENSTWTIANGELIE